MKLNSVKSFVVKTVLPPAFWVTGLGAASYCTYMGVDKVNTATNKAKTYIQKNDAEKYNELIEKNGYPRTFDWLEEADKLETKLKLDSIAKANYALGMQAVRDSLANANKK